MALLGDYKDRLKATWMKVNDQITEARLSSSKRQGLLSESIQLPDGFDPRRIRIIWPSSYRWPLAHKWMSPLLNELRRNFLVKFKPLPTYIREEIPFALIEVEIDGKPYPVAIDAYDRVEIDERFAAQAMVYFKMQYATEGYAIDNVVPGGFIPAYSNIYLHLKQARSIRDSQTYRYDTYGRFGARFAKSIRGQAVEKLSTQDRFLYEGGIGRVSYKDSLFEVARSKVCIDLPGFGPLCFRLIDYLAVGACIIAYPHDAKLTVPLIPGKEIVYCKPDFSDLIDLCEYYIHNHEEREKIAQASRAYFDTYLARPRLASYYMNTILKYAQV